MGFADRIPEFHVGDQVENSGNQVDGDEREDCNAQGRGLGVLVAALGDSLVGEQVDDEHPDEPEYARDEEEHANEHEEEYGSEREDDQNLEKLEYQSYQDERLRRAP
ncbi:MAG: hypothetical protein ACREBT_05900 [Thermoplasmata archaeon]